MTLSYVDTSALAKWYLNEARSDELEAFLQSQGPVHMSSLTQVEMRCLLARRRRTKDISDQIEAAVFATFQQDLADGHLICHDVRPAHFDDAVRLIGSLPGHPLRALDGLHLAVAHREGLSRLVTADHVMAAAGEGMGLDVVRF